MKKNPEFHGSDLEQISTIYHIPKEEIIPFGANVNPLGLSASVKESLSCHLDIISSYPDRSYSELKASIAAYCSTTPAHVVVGNGATELISLFISHLSPKEALVLGPTYSEYARELSLSGGRLTSYRLREEDSFLLDVPDFLSHLSKDTNLVIICNPNNPTSSAVLQEDMERILRACQEREIFVMVDETYVEFSSDLSQITSIPLTERYDNLLVIRGVSKFFAAPGLRFGYGVTKNREFLEYLAVHQNPWSLNSIAAFAGEQMLKDADYIQKTRQLVQTERTRILKELAQVRELKVYNPHANFILARILKEGVSSFDLFEAAIRERMMIRDCSSFFRGHGGEYIRFCFMMPEENTRLLNCLKNALKS